jgi:hypothetical protein
VRLQNLINNAARRCSGLKFVCIGNFWNDAIQTFFLLGSHHGGITVLHEFVALRMRSWKVISEKKMRWRAERGESRTNLGENELCKGEGECKRVKLSILIGGIARRFLVESWLPA